MKKIYLSLILTSSFLGLAQNGSPATPYYDGFDWNLRGMNLKNELANKITSTHTKILTYAQAENAIKIVDLDPNDATNTNVLLVYGFNNTDVCVYISESNFGTSTTYKDHRRRHKEADVSSGPQCAWNREHVYAQSLGDPDLGQVGAGADVHHLRASDVDRNADRGSEKFIDGTGNSTSIVNNVSWYPGDEWKGDVARMMMYLYLRYPTQCKPINVGFGNSITIDPDMIDLFLKWNAEDPVSQYEDNRNTYLGNSSNAYGQGNRNPFIDNPYLATLIWGGTTAQNRWSFLSNEDFELEANSTISPNPSNGNFNIDFKEFGNYKVEIFSTLGQKVYSAQENSKKHIKINNIQKGIYLLKISKDSQSIVEKIVIN
ncbi:endonuclease [Flavobacterium sp. H122]|uniref:endonuclease n=1 Tax=Flavobacterium sp. H122 TaxID=2529860 RepID=UPI00145C0CD4|nr:endonuclease [Flavobacterium sp. H122]